MSKHKNHHCCLGIPGIILRLVPGFLRWSQMASDVLRESYTSLGAIADYSWVWSQAARGCLRLPATNLVQSWMVTGLILAQSGTGREICRGQSEATAGSLGLILRSAQDDHKTGYSTHFCQECTRFYRNKGR